ncbi:MAG: MarP family serine protease [Chloroflexota bacterium]|nr:MarP family serine protease [Chloroflexota bacterium]
MNIVDFIAVVIVLVTIYLGARSGFVAQALALAGFAIGILIVIAVAPFLAQPLANVDAPLRGLIALGAMAFVVLIAQAGGSAVGVSIRRRMGRTLFGGVDNAAGALFGMLRGIFLVWLAGGLIALAPVPRLQAEARQSLLLRALETRLPSPIVLAAELGRLIEAAGLPTDVFVGTPPSPAPPIDGPSEREANEIAEPALASTLRVEATACGRFYTGTGFAVRPNHLITNAHVVAGSDRVWVSVDGSLDRHAATVVHYDPKLDAAVVYAPGVVLTPLTLAADVPERGQPAAAVGFPGGGAQQVKPAAISRTIEALGRDIYGQRMVERVVIEMRADVRPGDSGGPLVLGNGSVGGVTFSESRDNTEIGYALTPTAVAESVGSALSSTTGVSTEGCLPSPP